MTSIASSPINVQASAQSVPALPCWFGEITLILHHLHRQGALAAIEEHVRFARRRFGRYDVIDFVAVLFGYAISGERTLEAFYEQIDPWAEPFMALFGRDRLPARSTLSRFLAALTAEPVETLRSLMLSDLVARSLAPQEQMAGLWDRTGTQWHVFDLDGTREAARQRALPADTDRPAPQRRLRPLCAPGYTGRKRGELVRSRTTVLHAHTHQWLATFGNPGNGAYRAELRRGIAAIEQYCHAHILPVERVLLRLDGQYGTGAVLADLANLSFVMRGKDYRLLERSEVQARLHLPADQQCTHPESGVTRTLYDCPDVAVGSSGRQCRVVVATHPTAKTKSPVGVERDGLVYELFLTRLPQHAFTATDVVALYLHRGAFEVALADEDAEQDPDRWCSHAAWGQECWQVISQWVWNLRLELGHQLEPVPVRTTEFASALSPHSEPVALRPTYSPPPSGYDPPTPATDWKTGRFTGADFPLQPDGTLLCPAGKPLHPQERRRETDGSLRVVYAASIRHCRPCSLRQQCQWNGSATAKPRQVSVLLHPRGVGSAPLLWRDWDRRQHRHACMQLVRHQRVEVSLSPPTSPPDAAAPETADVILSRPQRAHARLSWVERLARNARVPTTSQVTIRVFGVPDDVASALGLATG